jgi:hypothetical protein
VVCKKDWNGLINADRYLNYLLIICAYVYYIFTFL